MASRSNILKSFLVAAFLLASGCTTTSQILPQPYSTIVGTWGFANNNECAQDPRTFVFSDGLRRMDAVHKDLPGVELADPRSHFSYSVLSSTPTSLHVALDGEDRLDDSGKPVTWHLVVFDRNTLKWHRSDWAEGEFTPKLVRCEI
jgi:hypothetical protein